MSSEENFQELLQSLNKSPSNRTAKDVLEISSVIVKYFESLDLDTAKYLSNFAHLISFGKDDILYSIDEYADCWYILLSGSVFLKGKVYPAPCSFGKRYDGQVRRAYQCKAVEYSQLMKILYPSADRIGSLERAPRERGRYSDWEDAHNNKNVNDSSEDDDEDDETLQDSFSEFDFSDLANESFTSITVKDVVQECLEKRPSERSEQDIRVLREFMLHFNNQVFNGFQREVQCLMCRKLSYVVVEKEGVVVLSEGEELKFWAFVIDGCLEVVRPHGETYVRLIHMGDSFGLDPQNETLTRSQFTLLTRVPSCHYITLTKEDWDSIIHKEGKCVEKETIEDGKKVLVVEEREIKKGGRKGCFVKKGTNDQLIRFLVDDQSTEDVTYAEDFLLTSRAFLQDGMASLTDHLILWFNSGGRSRDKSVRIVLLWVNNHFKDFETDFVLSCFLATFMQLMQRNGMSGQLELLHRACCAQATTRKVSLERISLSQQWSFNVAFGKEIGKVFVDNTTISRGIDLSSRDEKSTALLIRGYQILEVNGKSVSAMSSKCFMEVISKSTKLELQVKCNFVDYAETSTSNQKIRNIFPKQSCSQEDSEKLKKKSEWSTKRLFSNVIEPLIKKINLFGQSASLSQPANHNHSRHLVTGSNPDLSSLDASDRDVGSPSSDVDANISSNLFRVYLVNQQRPVLLGLNERTNVLQVVKMALKSIGWSGDAGSHSLVEVTFRDGRVVKYSRLPDCTFDLQSRTQDDTRIYLVANSVLETNWVNELTLNHSQEMNHQCQVLSLWHMKPQEVANELCLRDFQLFRNIQSSEYVDRVFNKNSIQETPNLDRFSKLVNEEMFWVATEICSETNHDCRVKLVQFFLKISQHCLEMNNFNSTFAILSGLRHISVSKLKQTWKRVPTKYMKLFESLQDLLDPSNNMSKYRNLLSIRLAQSPAIPFFPIVMKDLTFIDLGNKTHVDGLINYEKMRMAAKQIRSVTNMASTFYHNKSLELQTTLNSGASSPPSNNVVAFATIRKKRSPYSMSAHVKSEECLGLAKKYFENLKIIQDEDELEKLSQSLEPQRNPSSRSRSELSPQNMTRLNLDTKVLTSLKFGTDSPQSLQKLIGLTEKISPYSHNHHMGSLQQVNKKRPNALSLSSYDTLMLTVGKSHELVNPAKKGQESSGTRRGAVLLSPTCGPKIAKLTAESSSVSAPIRYNPSANISKALFALTNNRLVGATLRPQIDEKSASSSAEELGDIFSWPILKSQSTPVSPCRSVLTMSSTPQNTPSPATTSGGDVTSGSDVTYVAAQLRVEEEDASVRNKRKSLARQKQEMVSEDPPPCASLTQV